MMLLALASIIACPLAARGFQLQSRAITVGAVCESSFSWANNSIHQSPCEVVANVNVVCNGNWTVPALTASDPTYTPPEGAAANPCTCSWVSYNLLMACAACQGFDSSQSWPIYNFSCTGKSSDTYFPSSVPLPQNISIPYWAITDPTKWTDSTFNPVTAETISTQGHADVGNVPASTKSKPIGAIVGGVVGGVVVLLAAIIFGIYLVRRNSVKQNGGPSPLLMANQKHLRSQSEVTAISNNASTPNGYTSLSSSPMRPPNSPTIRTHATSSIRSFPFFSSGGSTVYSPPSVRQQSPPPASVHRDETAVEPFVLPPSNRDAYNPDRKQANGAYPVYDPPTAPPAVRMEVRPTTPTQGGRTRYNPPAYTEPPKASPEAGGSASRRRPPPTTGPVHAKKGSADTQHSMTSNRSGGGGSAARVGGNVPTIGNVVNQFAPVGTVINPQSSSHDASANATPGHGRQLSGNTSSDMDRKRRPDTEDSFNPRDLA